MKASPRFSGFPALTRRLALVTTLAKAKANLSRVKDFWNG
jgi:hypothetical protein